MKSTSKTMRARLRIDLQPGIAIGPGKADILEGVRETGSIAAAGRRLGMSYKRAWLLVDSMNAHFKKPLVETSRGGSAHGGASLTPTGEQVLELYRRMEEATTQAVSAEIKQLHRLLR